MINRYWGLRTSCLLWDCH